MAQAPGTQDLTHPTTGSQLPRPAMGFVGLTTASGSRHSIELRPLLWRRLRGICLILLALLVFMDVRTVAIQSLAMRISGTGQLILVSATLFIGLCSVVLYRDRGLSTQRLRQVELAIFAGTLLVISFMTVIWLGRGAAVPSLLNPALAAQLKDRFWILTPENGVYVPAGYQALQGFIVLRWCCFAVLYGVTIPNTWRRCALMMSVIIFFAIASILAAAWQVPALWRQAGLLLTQAVPLLGAFAAIGLYGCHKLSDLQHQVLAAKQVGQYHLMRRLGGGGMGEVYLARHRMLRRPCAVKLIRPDRAASSAIVARFEREVQAMARLTHPNTVEIYDYGRTDDGMFYYVMEFLPGTSLETLVRRTGPLPPSRAIFLLQQICRALQEAHAAGLIHRDIKPGEVAQCRSRRRARHSGRLRMGCGQPAEVPA